MSLWYDIKNKVYSSDAMDNWYVAYMQRCCDFITTTVASIYSEHASGSAKRHKCEHIDFDDSTDLRTAFDNAVTERNNALSTKVDKESGKQLSTNDYNDEEMEKVAKSAGKKVTGNIFSTISRLLNGQVTLTPTSKTCKTGSEVFNDYTNNQAQGLYSHAEGQYTSAIGDYSHAMGILTKANGYASCAEGEDTCASGKHQHVQGILNIEDTSNRYAHIVGNGYYEVDSERNEVPIRQNAHTLDWDGNAWYAGDVRCGNSQAGLQEQITDLYNMRPMVLNEVYSTVVLNSIYDLGQRTTLSLNIPDGIVGDWIKVDFISGETPTDLSIISSNISDYSFIPEANTAYTLIFDWGKLTSDTYGWRFSYNEYTKAVA